MSSSYGPRPIRNWIICISGYLQRYGQTWQGMPYLWHCMRNLHHKDVEVEFYVWDSDFDGVAEMIFRTSRDNGTAPVIYINAYSWGGGYGAVSLVRALAERGLRVELLMMCDAVKHFGGRWAHKLGISQILAYNWGLRIRLPRSVNRVISYVQKNSRLRGHLLVWDDPGADGQEEPCCEQVVIPFTTHTNMDENAEYRMHSIKEANALFKDSVEGKAA